MGLGRAGLPVWVSVCRVSGVLSDTMAIGQPCAKCHVSSVMCHGQIKIINNGWLRIASELCSLLFLFIAPPSVGVGARVFGGRRGRSGRGRAPVPVPVPRGARGGARAC